MLPFEDNAEDMEEEDTSSIEIDPYKTTREFMIPYPRLGRYMDYATLNALAEYLKQNPRYSHGRADLQTSLFKIAEPSAVLQRDLRDMTGKRYGIPIPRVGKRSIGEQIPLSTASNGRNALSNESLRSIISEYFRNMENNVKRQPARSDSSSSSTWARPIPRVGKRSTLGTS